MEEGVEERPENFVTRRQAGTFTISRDLVDENPDDVLKVLSQFLVTRCELMEYGNVFEYRAYSPLFRQLGPGEMMPEYRLEYDSEHRCTAVEEWKPKGA